MSVSNIYYPEQQPIDVGQSYDFTFESIGPQAVEVYEVDVAGNRTFITAANYTLTLNPGIGRDNQFGAFYNGGNVLFTVAHDPATTHINIERNTPITQNVDFQAYDRFASNVLEWTLDKITMILQEISARKCDKIEVPPT